MSNKSRALVALSTLLLLSLATAIHAAVVIEEFNGTWGTNRVELSWRTGSEADHAGFYVWRSTQNLPIDSQGQIDKTRAQKLNNTIITNPLGICDPAGQSYEFADTTLASGQAAYYYLESIHCRSTGSVFEGNGQGGGLPVASPTPTAIPGSPTASPTASRTPTATATNQAEASSTPQNTAVAASNTPVPSATTATGVTATATAPNRAASPTTAAAATSTRAAAPATATSATTATDPSPAPAEPSATSEAQGGAEGESAERPDPTATVEVATTTDAVPTAVLEAPGGEMNPNLTAATPTVGSAFVEGAGGSEELVAGESGAAQGDGLDRVVQGFIALILLGVVALIGFVGWSYAKR